MKKKIWFKAKTYGWGWQPLSWEGWLITVVYVMAVIKDFLHIDRMSHSGSDTLIAVAPHFIILTICFLGICYVKGEKPHWSWGRE
jgi:hypothetical protein